ncbi:putative bifunctional diguanylate cyclase/phosphodiesterase [Anoxynatronum buryatiense]|uniref:Diguanylate cyclase (GGDEF) domain-containing protein n=1 Tax=Anoxynatronum buryatiense TaxID=489973 RepID=A0AA45WVX0_9CLOT|nr:EAL domain-containing protein [Anoxynatronum buryatiense]SMP56195.1 diguanylate cyclase (GGDEF) domain-containing protein [Anoxynatronum buryatiense]
MAQQPPPRLIKRTKLIGYPMILVTLGLIIISVAGTYTSRHLIINQIKEDGVTLARQIVRQIQGNESSVRLTRHMLETHISSANQLAVDNRDQISDEYLTYLTQITLMDEITWHDADGRVLFASDKSQRRPVAAGDSLYAFLRGPDQELMEPLRFISLTGENYQYGALKHPSGEFVRSGILADNVLELTRQFSYQTLVAQVAESENLTYALVVDRQMTAIADSDLKDIGIRYVPEEEVAMQAAFRGATRVAEWYDESRNERVMEVITPIITDGEINHVLIVGMSMASVYAHFHQMTLIFVATALAVLLAFLWLQRRHVMAPVKELDAGISSIDIKEQMDYRIQLSPGNPFLGLAATINQILDRTQQYFTSLQKNQRDLEISNQNITEAYQRIQASEEALNDQLAYITEQQEWIQHQAYHDDLTQLPNRRHFMERLASCLQHEFQGAVILVDTDNFKSINDTMGHIFGDKVLKQMGRELVSLLGKSVFLSRFGGDEFLILLDRPSDSRQVESVALAIKSHFSRHFSVEETSVHLTLSMGIATYPEHGQDPESLIMKADMALHRVKTMGKNNYLFFDESMTNSMREKARVENILREALETDGFTLHYQPQVAVKTGKLTGFEALLRLKDFSVPPGIFISVAEEIGLILEIGRWVTRAVIRQVAAWQEQELPVMPVSINFSALQLNDTDYVDFLKRELYQMNVPPRLIMIEITESIFLDNREETLRFLHQLKNLGVTISIDDFGTGYSSLSYLTEVPADLVKLDKSLIDRYLEKNSQAVIDSMIALIHSLNLEVLAEGVEEKEQFRRLASCGCDYIQGYLFSKPLPPEDAVNLFHQNFTSLFKEA